MPEIVDIVELYLNAAIYAIRDKKRMVSCLVEKLKFKKMCISRPDIVPRISSDFLLNAQSDVWWIQCIIELFSN